MSKLILLQTLVILCNFCALVSAGIIKVDRTHTVMTQGEIGKLTISIRHSLSSLSIPLPKTETMQKNSVNVSPHLKQVILLDLVVYDKEAISFPHLAPGVPTALKDIYFTYKLVISPSDGEIDNEVQSYVIDIHANEPGLTALEIDFPDEGGHSNYEISDGFVEINISPSDG